VETLVLPDLITKLFCRMVLAVCVFRSTSAALSHRTVQIMVLPVKYFALVVLEQLGVGLPLALVRFLLPQLLTALSSVAQLAP
jgi:hypothetical protein